MKLTVTGGAGFLGFHLCKGLTDKFDEIFVADVAPIDAAEYPSNVKYFNVSILDFTALDKVLANSDVVVHGAAALPLWKKKDIFSTNVQGTRNVLESALKNGIKRVVFVSSTAVYGIPKEHPIYESAPFIGVGPYGESKIEAEKICQE